MVPNESRFWTPGRLIGAFAILVLVAGIGVGALSIVRTRSIAAFVESTRADDAGGVRSTAEWLVNRGWLTDAVRKVLSEQDTRTKFYYLLEDVGPSVVPTLCTLTEPDEDRAVREAAIGGIWLLAARGEAIDTARSTLVQRSTEDPSPEVRYRAISAYGMARIGEIPDAFVVSLRDPEPMVRLAAATAIGRIDPEKADLGVPVLVELLRSSEDPRIAMLAINGLVGYGPNGHAAIPALIAELGDSSHAAWAAVALVQIDREAAIAAGVDPTKFEDE